jgi:hypothetical protein
MALNISLKLARLIRARAYAGGTLRRAERRLLKLQEQLAIAESEYGVARAEVAKLDVQFVDYTSIDPSQIRRIGPKPRRGKLRHGAFSTEILRYLRDVGRPVSTQEIILQMETVFSLSPVFGEERAFRRSKTRRRLREFGERGVIRRLHNLHDNQVGVWEWVQT